MSWRDRAEWYCARNAALDRDGDRCRGVTPDGERCPRVQQPMAYGSIWDQWPRPTRLHVHHVVPVARGGDRYALENLVTLCASCHWQVEGGYMEVWPLRDVTQEAA